MEREKRVFLGQIGDLEGGFFRETPDSSTHLSPLDPFFKVEEKRKTIPSTPQQQARILHHSSNHSN